MRPPEFSGFVVNSLRRVCVRAAVFALILVCTGAGRSQAQYASLLMDAGTGRVLYETNADSVRYPASLTKMMTLYLLFRAMDEGRLRRGDHIYISSHAAAQPPTKLGLRPGQSLSVEDAILALVTKSANDIAAAIGETLGGSESSFASMMTQQAHALGMYHTHFANASGLPDPNQVTTARDMAILALALLKDFPQYYYYFSTQRFYFGRSVLPNHNRLLGVYPGLDGIKTGYTALSKFNLVASAQRDGRRLIGVVLGARSLSNRSAIMTNMLDQGFAGDPVITAYREPENSPVLPAAAYGFAARSVSNSGLATVTRTTSRSNAASSASSPPAKCTGARARKSSSCRTAIAASKKSTGASKKSRTVATAASAKRSSATTSKRAVVASIPSKTSKAKGGSVAKTSTKATSTKSAKTKAVTANSKAPRRMKAIPVAAPRSGKVGKTTTAERKRGSPS